MLTPDGHKLRQAIAEAGFEVTPDELEGALIEAEERISGGACRYRFRQSISCKVVSAKVG
jgi:hypothetical protein